jgi:hypothetical protein
MGNYPWGPHGPSYDGPPQVTPNPTAPTPVDNSSYTPVGMPAPNAPYVPGYSGGYSGGPGATPGQAAQIIASGAKGDFLLNLVAVGCVWPLWICLYPIAAAAGYFALLFGAGLAIRYVPRDAPINPNLIASAIGIVAGLIVLWNVSRFEHILARFNAYRIPRHAVRLALIAGLAALAIQRFQGIPISYMAPNLNFRYVFSDPKNIGIVLAVVVASHFILWNWKWARDFWNRRLTAAQLRRRGT